MKKKTEKEMAPGGSGKAQRGNPVLPPQDSAQLLHSIIQGFSIPAFVLGKDHKIIYWNRALERLSNISMKEVVGTRQQWRAFYAEARPAWQTS